MSNPPKTTRHMALKAVFVLLIALLAACLPGSADSGIRVLPALKDAKLTGSLVFLHARQNGSQVIRLDLASGKSSVLFSAPERSWLASLAVAPDGKTIVLAYAPPLPAGQTQFGNTDFYTLPIDGGAPQLLIAHTMINEAYFNPTFSADGKALYYSHNIPSQSVRSGVESLIEQAYFNGSALSQPRVLLHNAINPALSPDGAKLSYLTVSDVLSNNELYLAAADGTSPAPLVTAKQIATVDAHLFSPDGRFVYFSAPVEGAEVSPTRPWIERAFGVQPVSAHEEPSDWFRVPVSGGTPVQITKIKEVGLAGAFSPDGQRLAFISDQGVYVMQPDGAQLTKLTSGAAMGPVAWVK